MLLRDGVFSCEEVLPLMAKGDKLDPGFGAYDLVKLYRREVENRPV